MAVHSKPVFAGSRLGWMQWGWGGGVASVLKAWIQHFFPFSCFPAQLTFLGSEALGVTPEVSNRFTINGQYGAG